MFGRRIYRAVLWALPFVSKRELCACIECLECGENFALQHGSHGKLADASGAVLRFPPFGVEFNVGSESFR